MEGLAEQMAQPAGGAQPQGGMPTIEQVIELLVQGADPEELIQMGIPQELIIQAIQVLEQQMTQQSQVQAQPGAEAGLAQAMA